MEFTTWPRWDEIRRVLTGFREDIVLDCGHVSVRHDGQKFTFGGVGGVSDTALLTFDRGLALSRWLRAQGHRVKLNVCLSDTSRLLARRDKKSELRAAVSEQRYASCLPEAYLTRLQSRDFEDLVVMLQTQNSNRYAALIKKAKARVKGQGSPSVHGRLYEERGSVLLKSHDGERFAISGPFLMDTTWMRDGGDGIDMRAEDRTALEVIRNDTVITLYQKGFGPLCPATYGGLLVHYGEQFDHVCLYSRDDDPYISEKIHRGVIATNWLKADFSRACFQIVFPEVSSTPELSLVRSEDVRKFRPPWGHMLNYLTSQRVFDTMSLYTKSQESTSE